MQHTITQITLPGLTKLKSGKVREVFDLGDALLFVATDRLSAFDVILPNPIPDKGRVLTALSEFWFKKTQHIVANHFLTSDFDEIARRCSGRRDGGQGERNAAGTAAATPAIESLRNRAMLVRKCQPLPVECVVRGYLAGSGWKEYKLGQTVCGTKLPAGLKESSELPQPIFTPATKAETGHDENIDFARYAQILGQPIAEKVRDLSVAIYNFARQYARQRGIIIADTKFEFGVVAAVPGGGQKLLLIDEALTPDSSRFWPADGYQPGQSQPSFDKQFVRDYLETLTWDKKPPGPNLPADIIRKTSEKYLEALARLTAGSA